MSRCLALALLALCLACSGTGPAQGAGESHDEPHGAHEPGESASGVVRLTPEAIERSGIRLATVEGRAPFAGLELPAEVEAVPERTAHVAPLASGQVAEVRVTVGDRVRPGQVLAVLSSVQLGDARAALDRARASAKVARTGFERQRLLRKEGIGSERAFQEAESALRQAEARLSAARRALEVYGREGTGSSLNVTSPIEGEIVDQHASVGEVVGPTDVLFRITDIRQVWVVGRAYQQHAGRLEEGARATVTLQAYPGRTWEGQVEYVAPVLDPHTRTLPVRVTLDNPGRLLRPGLFGTLSVVPMEQGDPAGEVPVIERSAVQRLEEQSVVFVPGEAVGEFHATPVAVGPVDRGRVAVLMGLEPGERYVAEGGFVLKSELLRGQLGEGHAH